MTEIAALPTAFVDRLLAVNEARLDYQRYQTERAARHGD